MTAIVDTDQRRVIDVVQGREKSTVSAFADKPAEYGGSREALSAVTYVKQVMIKALDNVHKEDQRTTEEERALFRITNAVCGD